VNALSNSCSIFLLSIFKSFSVKDLITPISRFKLWVDEASRLFGGLDICAVEAVVGKDGKEYIIEVDDCAMSLMGETQEEDRRLMADLGEPNFDEEVLVLE
jgi:hypothetical protein